MTRNPIGWDIVGTDTPQDDDDVTETLLEIDTETETGLLAWTADDAPSGRKLSGRKSTKRERRERRAARERRDFFDAYGSELWD